jgi:hypothetical protein
VQAGVNIEARRANIPGLKKLRPIATRLAVREYLPFGAWLLAWSLIGLTIGHADAVRLLAANAFVQAIRSVGLLEVGQVLSGRVGCSPDVFRRSRRRAWRIDLLGLLASAVLLWLVAIFLDLRGMEKAAMITAVVGAGIPARNPGLLLVAGRQRVVAWRMGSSVVLALGAIGVFLAGLPAIAAAAVFAAREWGGLLATLLFAPARPARQRPPAEPLRFRDVAGRTEASARRRLSYRLIKSLATIILGPFGNFAARTGREVGKIDSRLARFVPRNKPGMILFTLGTGGTAAFFLLISTEPASLLAGAAFARLAATGATALMWWRYSSDDIDLEEDDD